MGCSNVSEAKPSGFADAHLFAISLALLLTVPGRARRKIRLLL